MKELILNQFRKTADCAGRKHLTGSLGARRLRRLLPRPLLHSFEPPWENVLVLAPHPDDEIFGAGLLLEKLRKQNRRITIAFATNGAAYKSRAEGNRKEEAQHSAARLNAKAVFMDFPDGQVQNTPGVEQKLAQLCTEVKPDAIVLPWFGDYHPDHRALAKAMIQKPYPSAQYLFYSTFTPLWPIKAMQMVFIMGSEGLVRPALADYSASASRETVNAFFVLRRALARCYLNNSTFWEPMLSIPGSALADVQRQVADWPQIFPTLKRARHSRRFFRDLQEFRKA